MTSISESQISIALIAALTTSILTFRLGEALYQ